MSFLEFDNLRIEVTRKPIRTLRMIISPPDANVRVSAPVHVGEREIMQFIEARRAWIRRHRERILACQANVPPPFVCETGETFPLWGAQRTLHVNEGAIRLFRVEEDALYLGVRPHSTQEERRAALEKGLRPILMTSMEALAAYWLPIMGLSAPLTLRIRKMKTRWGTCNPGARRIWINFELVQRPPRCLEYVMVHELAHLFERGHNARFRTILDRHLPDWKLSKKMLNEAPPSQLSGS